MRSVVYHRRDLEDADAAGHALQNICIECSKEWVDRRTKIVREAAFKHSNPRSQSEYCLNALREIVYEASKEAATHKVSPETVIVRRQVLDHLRELNDKGVLTSHMKRTKAGRDHFKFWGLKEWGANWVTKRPEKPLEKVERDLPIILAYREGKGIFDYASILPSYIPGILMAYGAALSTDEISSLVSARISPPLFRSPDMLIPIEDFNPWETGAQGGYQKMSSPEDLMVEEQLKERFFSLLTDRERKIYEMSEEGMSVEQIAGSVECSPRNREQRPQEHL